MWADLTGSAGSRPLWEGARDHMTSCVASFLFSSSPAASAPTLSPSKISLFQLSPGANMLFLSKMDPMAHP
ncbi:hypothetical protein K443DRAFT_11182 [Laccaria amethystina LaAM-08-1]|uniref:Uncharacterized protein n=1 Tax=Laccaria amethystina LaAM-08-1 TaxID=1095629 RepID=A0A0C9WK31_9AGAR|nr:hypothetical protein K443DRAFT_11182 [Laccaria amethystina LaAM-08-1]